MILVTGASGFLGKRVCRLLSLNGLEFQKTSLSLGLDLRDQKATVDFFLEHRPKVVLNCASFVGGIQYGYKYPADLFKNNSEIINNLFYASSVSKVSRIVNPISNCVYPAKATLFKEEEIWDGPMHESVMVYGMVRKASWIASWAYAKQFGLDTVNLVLSNMYGPEDHFEEERSHAFGALLMKFIEAKKANKPTVTVWGTGNPVREWMYVDDGADAMIKAMDVKPTTDFLNIGVASGISIKELAFLIQKEVGYAGEIIFDHSKPDGAAFKTVDGSKGNKVLGWSAQTNISEGLKATVNWYHSHAR